MKVLWDAGQGLLKHAGAVLVEKCGDTLVEADCGCRLAETGRELLLGWDDFDGETVIVERVDGCGSYRVPVTEWARVNRA